MVKSYWAIKPCKEIDIMASLKASLKASTVAPAADKGKVAPKIIKAAKRAIKATPTALALVTSLAFNSAEAGEKLRLAFIAAGGNQDAPRKALLCGRVMFSLKCTQEHALNVMGKAWNPKLKTDVPDTVKNVKEQRACVAAGGYLSARLKEWGIKTTSTQGGDRSDKTASARKTMSTEKLVQPKKPMVETSPELGAYCMAWAKSGYDLFLLNKNHQAVVTPLGSALMGLFADFAASVAETVAEHSAPAK